MSTHDVISVWMDAAPHPLPMLPPFRAGHVYAAPTRVEGCDVWRFWLGGEERICARILPLGDADRDGYSAEDQRAVDALWSAYPSLKRVK